MAKLAAAGKIQHVGVSNFSAKQMREADRVLREHGLRLASNQVKYSLLDRRIEQNGILETAKELGCAIIAYSPLEQGILSGKFHHDPALIKAISGPRKWSPAFQAKGLNRSKPLIDSLEQIAVPMMLPRRKSRLIGSFMLTARPYSRFRALPKSIMPSKT